jgi:uncharacterized membrane protein
LSQTSKLHEANIDTIVRLEAKQEDRLSQTDRLSEAIGQFAGTNAFVVVQIALVATWVMINRGTPGLVPIFDPRYCLWSWRSKRFSSRPSC